MTGTTCRLVPESATRGTRAIRDAQSQKQRLVVLPAEAGSRLDLWLASRVPEFSRSQAGRLAQEGRVTLQGAPLKASYRVREGDEVLFSLPPAVDRHPLPEARPLVVLYEDEHLLVLDKPRDLVIHPAAGATSGTLVNALLSRGHGLSSHGGQDRPGIVHRLDRHTSGVMVVAKDDETHRSLKSQLADRTVRKEYLALVNGSPSQPEGRVEARIARHPVDRKRMSVTEFGGRDAVTDYRLEEALGPGSLVRALPRTGRTHQIRVHLAHLHCPLMGDLPYGGRKRAEAWARQHGEERLLSLLQALSGQALHAERLGFSHPGSGRWMTFEAPLPADMSALIEHLRTRSGGHVSEPERGDPRR